MAVKTGFMKIVSGHIGNYDVFISGDTITVIEDKRNPQTWKRNVQGFAKFMVEAKDFRIGWGNSQATKR